MIRYLEHEQIDKKKWDDCIARSFNSIIYAFSWYLDIVSEDWDALVEDDFERVMPLTQHKKLFTNYLSQPPFTQQLGIFSIKKLNSEIIDDFIRAIPLRFRFVEINLNSNNKLERFYKFSSIYRNFELDLISPYEYLRSNYSENRKRNLKAAVRSGVNISKNLSPDKLINLYGSNQANKYGKLSEKKLLVLKRLIYGSIYKGLGKVYGAYTADNNLCAGAFFLVSGNRAIFLFSAYNAEASENHGMSLLIDHFIAEHSPGPITLDFEGSNNPGLARFYSSFGSTECAYSHLHINRFGFLKKIIFRIYKRLFQK